MKKPEEILKEFAQIPGQDMIEYVPFLQGCARGKVLEIGVCAGVSTSAFLTGMDAKREGHLWSIDRDPACAGILAHPRWTFILGDSRTMGAGFDAESIDVLLIDGDHDYDSVMSDLQRFSPLVKRGGLVLVHDVDSPDFPECRKAWDDFCAAHPTWAHNILVGLFGLGVILKR